MSHSGSIELYKYRDIAAKVAGFMLLLAALHFVFGLPYAYFQILRIVVSIAATFVVITARDLERTSWVVAGVAILILWNPFSPISLGISGWIIPDIIAGALMLSASRHLQRKIIY